MGRKFGGNKLWRNWRDFNLADSVKHIFGRKIKLHFHFNSVKTQCKRHVRRFLSNVIAAIRIKSNQTDLIRIFLQVECDFFALLVEYRIGCYTQK